jgi:ATP-dependent DNA helicase RecG
MKTDLLPFTNERAQTLWIVKERVRHKENIGMKITLDTSIIELKGVGPERAGQLARLEIRSVEDLLLHGPRRYEDRRQIAKARELVPGKTANVRGVIVDLGIKRYAKGTKSVFEFILADETGRLHCRWWNLPYMQNYFQKGDEVLVSGKVRSLRPATIDHPDTEIIETGEEALAHLNRIVPVYPLTEGLSQRWLRSLVWRVLEEALPSVMEPWPGELAPELPSRAEAVRSIHFPREPEDAAKARTRLALDEFIPLQLAIQQRRRNFEAKAKARPCPGDNHLIKPFLAQLGFRLTPSQTEVLREIRQDMSRTVPMRRLLQGDVGSGKTVVAACAALMALESGFNAALMAPTEILAEQHFQNFSGWFGPLNVSAHLRTGSQKREAAGGGIEPSLTFEGEATGGRPLIVIGTHALVQESFQMEKLGLVIIDEQHKFGVAQREALVRKGYYPHLLVMTATPIPRTLGLTLYGDLDSSVIRRSPPGRGVVKTYLRTPAHLPKIWSFVREKLKEGRQAYVVYPRVEEGEQEGIKAVTREFEQLSKELEPFRAGLLHGRMKAEEKEQTMILFRENQVQALLSTSLIEVGVDVPNATVMVIENADRFGLAQLHQLRGRIGRGAHQSFCILVGEAKSQESRERLEILEKTNDGFRIAEADLKLRGPGEFLGQQQSGMPRFRFGDLVEDEELVRRARGMAGRLLDAGMES